MEWFYAPNDQRLGPVSDAEFDSLVRSGTIQAETLVWRNGLAEWQPWRSLAPAGAAVPLGPVTLPADSGLCAECGRVFPKSDLLAFDNLFVCAACKPLFFQKVQSGVAVGTTGVWRSGKYVVMSLTPSLPDTCVKCNAPANGSRLKRKLRWHHPAVYLTLLANLLIYIIVASITSKRVEVQIGLCPVHRAKRVQAIVIGWVLALLGLGGIVWGIGGENGWAGLGGGLAVLGGLVWGIVGGRVVYAKKIDKEQARMGGCGKAYLDALPEWRGN